MKNFKITVTEGDLESEFTLEAGSALEALRTVTANMYDRDTRPGYVVAIRVVELEPVKEEEDSRQVSVTAV